MQPFANMQFRHSWRPYQQRVLDAVQQHLADQRLHVVAAPGAGKTTLGLEIFRRLGKATLVLSPTRVIRDQWVSRLADFVELPADGRLPWVSTSLRQPAVFTSVTYQALHSQVGDDLDPTESSENNENSDDNGLAADEIRHFVQTLQQQQIEVLMLDEAHHLRAAWWSALDKVCKQVPNLVLVSLTATPPLDAAITEWARYEQLCGPIDEEISVPELVKSGTLCPHQDFVWACNATQTTRQQVQDHDSRVEQLCQSLINNPAFVDLVLAHPWFAPATAPEALLKQPESAIALLSFLKTAAAEPTAAHGSAWHEHSQALQHFLDLSAADIPQLGRRWWQVLLQHLLFSKDLVWTDAQQQLVTQLRKELQAHELIHKQTVLLERSARLERSLSLNSAKIEACAQIHRLEYRARRGELRQVVLTDYIRDEALNATTDLGDGNLGAWPVFRRLVETSEIAQRIGLLTGRLCVIPHSLKDQLHAELPADKCSWATLDAAGHFLQVTAPLNLLTTAFTRLLLRGDLQVLVGTRALLGEGWDAPVVNSLILASSIGSFMLTNQMRGRAIRIDATQPGKVSSIWHLLAIAGNSPSGYLDYANLRQRFDTFVGLSEQQLSIESGYGRLHSPTLYNPQMRLDMLIWRHNRKMVSRFHQRASVATRWQQALTLNAHARVAPSVLTAHAPRFQGILLSNTWRSLWLQTVLALVYFSMWYGLIGLPVMTEHPLYWLMLVVSAVMLYHSPKVWQNLRVLWRHLPVDGSMKQMGHALVHALYDAGYLTTPPQQLKLDFLQVRGTSDTWLTLQGGSFYEASLFADCFAELLAPIENPRYLLKRHGKFLGQQRVDYHAVPLKLAQKKDTAELFFRHWQHYVCPSELIYTRSESGRVTLLKAQAQAFSTVFGNEVKRQDRWR